MSTPALELPIPERVWVSPIVTVNPQTKQKSQSTIWHYPESPCLTENMISMDYELSQALGYTLCGNCQSSAQKKLLQGLLLKVVPERQLLSILADLPEGMEIRVLYHPPGVTSTNRPRSPRMVWTSWVVEELGD